MVPVKKAWICNLAFFWTRDDNCILKEYPQRFWYSLTWAYSASLLGQPPTSFGSHFLASAGQFFNMDYFCYGHQIRAIYPLYRRNRWKDTGNTLYRSLDLVLICDFSFESSFSDFTKSSWRDCWCLWFDSSI